MKTYIAAMNRMVIATSKWCTLNFKLHKMQPVTDGSKVGHYKKTGHKRENLAAAVVSKQHFLFA